MAARKAVLVPAVVVAVAVASVVVPLVSIHRRGPSDPASLLAAAHTRPLDVQLVDPDGHVVAAVQLALDGTATMTVGELTATQSGDVLHLSVGDVRGVPAVDRATLLDALVARSHMRVVGGRIEADVGGGARLVVVPR